MEATTEDMTTVRISVTQADIDAGEQGHCEKCPIALAFLRAVPEAFDIDVNRCELEFDHPDDPSGDGLSLDLPGRATGFIDDFDVHGATSVEPFSFTLSLPLRLGAPEAEEARIEASEKDLSLAGSPL